MKLEYIPYTMTLDYKKKLKCNKMAHFWKKKFNFAKKSDGFWLGKIKFPFNHKTGGSLYRKTNTQ